MATMTSAQRRAQFDASYNNIGKPGWLSGKVQDPSAPANVATTSQRQAGLNLSRTGNMAGRVSGVGNEMLSTGRGLLSQWSNRANPLWGKLSSMANQSPDYLVGRAAVDSNKSFDESKGVIQRTLSRMGINPNSGRFAGLMQKWGLARAAAEAGAKTRAAQQAGETMYSRLAQLMGVANNGVAQGTGLISGAAGAYGNAGGMYNNLANQYGDIASGAAALDAYGNPVTPSAGLRMVAPTTRQLVADTGSSEALTPEVLSPDQFRDASNQAVSQQYGDFYF